jgi:hypothetical protein
MQRGVEYLDLTARGIVLPVPSVIAVRLPRLS